MRRLLAWPLLAAVCIGAELPEDVPIPAENPRHPQTREGTIPMAATKQAAAPPGISISEADEISLARCEAELRRLGSVFKREKPLHGEAGCGIPAPYGIDQIVRGVSLSPASQLRCATALALARWTGTVLVPLAETLPGEVALTRINHGSTYVCRRRNNLATGKMSEHATGNAIDITGFEFSGRDPIAVSPRSGDGTVEEAFQRAARGTACLHFTTVIGPGTNTSHADHLHLDIIERKRGYRLCQ